jgi:WD40 repeat protein
MSGFTGGGEAEQLPVGNPPCTCTAVFHGAHGADIWAVRGLQDGRVVTASTDQTLKIWDLGTQECVARSPTGAGGHTGWVLAACVLPVSGLLVSASADNSIRIWDAADFRLIRQMEHASDVWGLCALDDDRIITGSEDKTAKVSHDGD